MTAEYKSKQTPQLIHLGRHLENSPSEERRAGDEEGEEPHAEADVDGEALRPPAPGVRDGPRDGEVAVDRDGAQTDDDLMVV